MTGTWRICLISALVGVAVAAAEEPLRLPPAVVLDVLSTPEKKSPIRYEGQLAQDGRIDLTATNGFFDRCFQALEPQADAERDPFTGPVFAALGPMSEDVRGTARWHLWCPRAGEFVATMYLQAPASDAGKKWTFRVGDQSQSLTAEESDGAKSQSQRLKFRVTEPGRVTIAIDCTQAPPPADSRLRFIRLEGAAIEGASLLRTRWRPAAVHARFFAPPQCARPTMWVFETRSISPASSYSPLTTPFGYYGTSFEAGGKIKPGAGFNFSMWIAGREGTEAPPLERVARLIGTDLPDAKYSTFGHEGTGVKFRDAVAYPAGAERTIQALRIEADATGMLTYFGYFFDETKQAWRLYASAQGFPKKAAAKKSPQLGELRSTGSFCEIPGPPHRERSGDLVREIKRRGWFYDRADGKWHRAVLTPGGDDVERDQASSRRTYYLDDYAANGWMAMATGGMELYTSFARNPPEATTVAAETPEYLRPEKTAALFELPVQFGKSSAKEVTENSATVEIDLLKTGPNSQAVLHFGTVDCVTYPPQTIKNGSAVEQDLSRPERTWQRATPPQAVRIGKQDFRLSDLKPGTTYYYRLFVSHDAGQSWDAVSGSFRTSAGQDR